MIRFFLFLSAIFLTACGSAPVQRQPLAVEQAKQADKEARHALRDGQLQRAQQGFIRVLVLQQSLDDVGGAATTLINLATVDHQLNDDETALALLDRILLEKPGIYPAESQLMAAFRKGVILADLSRLSEAESALLLAEKLCDSKCRLQFGLDVLRARLLLLKGDAQGALSLAQASSSESAAGKEEQANALRIQAAAEESLMRNEHALQHYQAALEMDKSLGLGARIGDDLDGIARVSTKLGRESQAAEYARRAALVRASLRQIIQHD